MARKTVSRTRHGAPASSHPPAGPPRRAGARGRQDRAHGSARGPGRVSLACTSRHGATHRRSTPSRPRWAGLIGNRIRADAMTMDRFGDYDFDVHPFGGSRRLRPGRPGVRRPGLAGPPDRESQRGGVRTRERCFRPTKALTPARARTATAGSPHTTSSNRGAVLSPPHCRDSLRRHPVDPRATARRAARPGHEALSADRAGRRPGFPRKPRQGSDGHEGRIHRRP